MSLLDDVGSTFAGLGDLAASATLTRTVPGAYNPAASSYAAGTETTSACKAVLDASSLRTLGFRFGEGLAQGGDMLALVPARGLAFVPAAGDALTVAGQTFKVIANQPVYAGSVPVLHQLLVRA